MVIDNRIVVSPCAPEKKPGQLIYFSIERRILQQFFDGLAQLDDRFFGLVRQDQSLVSETARRLSTW
jgi:hypothetical protein